MAQSALLKTCKRCGRDKPPAGFYTRGLVCRVCTRAGVRANRAANAEYYRDYDATRRGRPKGTPSRSAASARSAKYYANNRDKVAARDKVQKALRSGRLVKPSRCSECPAEGVRLEAHHADYSKPLDVTWLCDPCHSKKHTRRIVSGFRPRKSRWLSERTEEPADG